MAKRYYEATTPKWQRRTIWIIALVMAVGTIMIFVVPIISNKNPNADPKQIAQERMQAEFDRLQAALDEKTAEYDRRVAAQNEELSAKYYDVLDGFRARVGSFDAPSITELRTEDLQPGDGAEITADNTDYSMFYIGWRPDGVIFDSSFDDSAERTLLSPLPGSGSYITGWNEGVIGMRIGGVRMITIPADKAYGEAGSGQEGSDRHIPPNTPLRFIVLAVPAIEEFKYPAGTLEACQNFYAFQMQTSKDIALQYCQMFGYDNEE